MRHISIFSLLLVVFLCGNSTGLIAQKDKKDDMKSKINRLLDDYNLYADLTEDGNKISTRYKDQFKAIFAKDAEVYNDMPSTPGFGKMQSPAQYTEELIEWFPKGLSTKLSNRKEVRRGLPETADYDTVYVYSVEKNINARDKNREKVDVTKQLYFVIGYHKAKDELRITHISKNDKEARAYAHLPGWYAGKIITNAPLQLSFGVMSALSGLSAKPTDIDEFYDENLSVLKAAPAFGWSANLQLLAGMSKRIQIGIGIGASQYRQHLRIDNLNQNFDITDNDGIEGTRHINIKDFTETYSQTMMQIPLFLRTHLTQTPTIQLFFDLGLAPSFALGKAGNSYKGTFSAYNTYEVSDMENVPTFSYTLRSIDDPSGIYDEAHNTHLGLYDNLEVDAEVDENNRISSSSFNLMALGGVGVSAKINHKLSFFGAARVYYGLLNQQNSTEDNTAPNWINALNYRSLLKNSPTLKPFMGGVELGILYNIRSGK